MRIRNYHRRSSSQSNTDIILVLRLSPLSDHRLTGIWSHVSYDVCIDPMSVMPAIYDPMSVMPAIYDN